MGQRADIPRAAHQQVSLSFRSSHDYDINTLLGFSVHGEYKFSQLDMPPPERSESTGGRLTGTTMRDYMEDFTKTFLDSKAKFRFQTEVLKIQRVKAPENVEPSTWNVEVKDLQSGSTETLTFSRIILATGVRFRNIRSVTVLNRTRGPEGMQ